MKTRDDYLFKLLHFINPSTHVQKLETVGHLQKFWDKAEKLYATQKIYTLEKAFQLFAAVVAQYGMSWVADMDNPFAMGGVALLAYFAGRVGEYLDEINRLSSEKEEDLFIILSPVLQALIKEMEKEKGVAYERKIGILNKYINRIEQRDAVLPYFKSGLTSFFGVTVPVMAQAAFHMRSFGFGLFGPLAAIVGEDLFDQKMGLEKRKPGIN